MSDADAHLLALLLAAADGRYPPVDGGITWLGPLDRGIEAVVCFTGHSVIATRLGPADFADLPLDGFGPAHGVDVLTRLRGPSGREGVTDAIVVGRGTGLGSDLPERHDLEDHHRVAYARSIRSAVTVHGDERGLITLSLGLAGRRELSIEAAPAGQGRGWGSSLLAEALALVPAGSPLFAAVSPGNARSLRAFLGAGFEPIGSETIILPRD